MTVPATETAKNTMFRKGRGRRRALAVLGAAAAVAAAALVTVLVLRPWAPPAGDQVSHRTFPRAAVAANGYECATIGRQILERNGSAVDAAIAILFCEGVACAQCMGLGGGFLAVVYEPGRGVRALNARERAPDATTANMYEYGSSQVGGLAVAVPGELRGYGELHREYGRLPWRDLVEPTAELCRRGHRVNEYMGRVLRVHSETIKNEPSMREVYVNPKTGEVWNEGDYIQQLQLAETLDTIASEGPNAMHNGTLTADFVRDVRDFGGIITEDDMRNYRTEWQDAIAVPLTDEQNLYSVPLPGSGSVLAFILNMWRGWIGEGTAAPKDSNLYWHRIVETFKFAYAKRTGLGDVTRPQDDLHYSIAELERNMSTPSWVAEHRQLVDDARTYNEWQHYGALFGGADDHGTAHIVVVAPDGSAVSATSTINFIWGAKIRSRSLGIVLNNEMDDFAIPNRTSGYGMPPSPANMLARGLQPLSSMVPAIVLDGDQVQFVVGAAGGTKITTQVALATMHTMMEQDDVIDVIMRPRLHHQLVPMEIDHEQGFNQNVLKSLRARGHVTVQLQPTAGFASMVAISREPTGELLPITDRRRVGSTDGL